MRTPRLAAGALLALAAAANGEEPLRVELVAASSSPMAEPHDIVLSPDGARLYVADNRNDRIVVLDPMTLAERGVFAKGEVGSPHDVDFDREGRLLVADTDNSRIAVYAVSGDGGRLVDSISGRISRPEGVAAHPDGRVLATGAASGNLVIFAGGEPVAETGGLASPHDVAIDAEGGFWVADAGNDRMVRFDEELRESRVLAGAPYRFSGPRYLDIDPRGRLWVADKYSHQVKVIAPDGTVVLIIGTGDAGEGPGRFDRPEGVEIRGEDVWLSDTYNDRIVRYRMVSGR